MNNKITTIFNFECKNCHYTAGQLITDAIKDENHIKCPKCGSEDCTYSTLLK